MQSNSYLDSIRAGMRERSPRERFERGRDLMDQVFPGWRERVYQPIDINQPTECPIGQGSGHPYYDGIALIMANDPEANDYESEYSYAHDNGFYDRGSEYLVDLNVMWMKEVSRGK